MRRALYTFAIDPDLRDGLRKVKARDGISESEQIRRAIRQWLKSKRIGTVGRAATKGR